VIAATSKRVDLNRATAVSVPYDNLGWANRLTIIRGLLIAMTGGFLFQDWPPALLLWVPGILYITAAVADRLDGYIARKSGQTSLLGLELDTVFDALGLAIAPLLAVWYGQIHWSYLLFSSAYYVFQWGMYRRKQKGLPVYSLPPNILRRAWAGFQMGFIAVVLLPLFSETVTIISGFAFMIPVLIGFIIDWMIVSGRIDRQRPDMAMMFTRMENFSQTVFLPALRGTLAMVLIAGVHQPDTLLEYGMLLTGGLILAGAGGRIAALILVGLLGFYYQTRSVDLAAGIAVFSTVWILLLGTGRYSLWRRDEDWVNRYDGA
jgi:CDP-diacylglycerol--glycerol-3-phosphate 3-phosphatidyltransferase